MAQQPPIFTDVGAYGRNVPGNTQVPNAAPVYEAVGDVAGAATKLAQVFYQQDQEKAVLDAKISMTQGFQALRQKVAQETDIAKLNQAFEEESAKIEAAVTANALDGRTANAIRADFAAQSQAAQGDVFRRSMALRSSEYVASADKLAEQLYQGAPLDADRHLTASKAQIQEQADAMARLGHLAPDKAADWRLYNLRRLDDGRATWDVKNAPEYALSLLEANKDGEWLEYKDLDVKRREVLIAQAKAGNGANAANVDEVERQGVKAVFAGTGDGQAQITEAKTRGAKGARLQDLVGNIAAANVAKSYLDRARFKPFGEMNALVADYRKEAAKPGNEYLDRHTDNLVAAVADLQKSWKATPAEQADIDFPLPKAPGGGDWPLAAKMAQRKAAMEVIGVSLLGDEKNVQAQHRLLTKAEVDGSVTTLVNTPLEDKARTMVALQQEMGDYVGLGVTQMRREGKLPSQYVLLADPGVTPTGANVLARTAGAKPSDLAKNLPNGTKDRDTISKAVKEKFQEGIGRTFANPQDRADFMEATVNAALYYGEKDVGNAPDRAYNDIWGKMQTIGTVRVPFGTTLEQGTKIQYAIEQATLNVERFKPLTGQTPLGEYRRRIMEEGEWKTYQGAGGKDEGIKLTWMDTTQVDVEGKPIAITFAEIYAMHVPTTEERNAQQAKALADPRMRARLATGHLPPTPGAYR